MTIEKINKETNDYIITSGGIPINTSEDDEPIDIAAAQEEARARAEAAWAQRPDSEKNTSGGIWVLITLLLCLLGCAGCIYKACRKKKVDTK